LGCGESGEARSTLRGHSTRVVYLDVMVRVMTKRSASLPRAGLLVVCLGAMASNPSRADDENARAKSASGAVPIEGLVTYDGPLPVPIPVAEAASVRHPVEVDSKTKGLKEAVIWLEGVPAGPKPLARKPPVQVDQRNFFFVPHVLAIDAGQEVEFLNSDVANHGITATSLEPENCFNVSIPLAGQRHNHRFVASTHPVAIGCPIHASMAAWIYVFEHPYHGVTDEDGRFRLPPVPPGRYALQIRHADGGMKKQEAIEVRAGETVRLRIEFHGADLRVRDGSGSGGGAKRP
jgi:plastocyanin